jgi:transposase InsO family protein
MGWQKVVEQMAFREELIRLGQQPGTNIRELCRRFQVSTKTYYKWLQRYQKEGNEGLKNQTRRPRHSPRASPVEVVEAVLELRGKYPYWGARKLEQVWEGELKKEAPPRSTIQDILKRNGCIDEVESAKHRPWHRFERAEPNQLWQMDFKGWPKKQTGYRGDPLSIVDDHSRYAVCLQACPNQQTETVRVCLTTVFQKYGLPDQMVMDNGSPWGNDEKSRHTPLTTWLMRLGIKVSHCRPYHPQTQGKVERFHRTLQLELLGRRQFPDRPTLQRALDEWRDRYNQHRPHESLNMQTPASRYRISPREFPQIVPLPEYDSTDQVRLVDGRGNISFRGKRFLICKGFRGFNVALRATQSDGVFNVFFFSQKVAEINLRLLT